MLDSMNAAFNELIKVPCPNPDLPPFCEFFVNIRLSHNLSVEELSKSLDVKKEQILRIEQGKIWGSVTPSMLIKLENIFNLRKGYARNYLKQSCLVK